MYISALQAGRAPKMKAMLGYTLSLDSISAQQKTIEQTKIRKCTATIEDYPFKIDEMKMNFINNSKTLIAKKSEQLNEDFGPSEAKTKLQKYQLKLKRGLQLKIAKEQLSLANAKYGVAHAEDSIALDEVKRAMALNYITKNSVNPKTKGVINDIYGKTTSHKLFEISKKYRISKPSEMRTLQITELKLKVANFEREQAVEIAKNPYVRNGINDFFETGKLEGNKYKLVKYTVDKSIRNYTNILDHHERHVDPSFGDNFYKILKKYKNIKRVPPHLYQGILLRAGSYLTITKKAYQINGKLLANYNSRDYLTKTSSKEKIEDCKISARTYAGLIEDISKFLGVKDKTPPVEDIAISPLQVPLLQNELMPAMKPHSDSLKGINNKYEDVTTGILALRGFSKMSEYTIERIGAYKYFKQAISSYSPYFKAVEKARLSAKRTVISLQALLFPYNVPKGLSPNMKRIRKKLILAQIKSIKNSFVDKRSPISIQHEAQIKENAQALIKGYNKYKSSRKKSALISISIVLVSSAFAAIGGGAAALVGRALLGRFAGSIIGRGVLIGMESAGSAIGGAVGTRLSLTAAKISGFTTGKSYGNIWGGNGLINDIGSNMLMGGIGRGGARLIAKGIKIGAASTKYLRFARAMKYSGRSSQALKKIYWPKGFASNLVRNVAIEAGSRAI